MARPRKPTNLLRLTGAFKANPQRERARANEPVVTTPLGQCPEWFSDEEKAAWADIVKYAPAGVLTSADTLSLELASRLLARSRNGQIVTNKVTGELYAITGLTSAEHSQLIALLGKFGMNPSDRSKVSAAPKPKETGWGAFGT